MLAAEVAAKRDVEDLVVIDKTAKWLIENYTGLEYKALMKDFLGSMRSNNAAKALTTILEKPEDPQANLTLGLHYALNLKQRKLGWNLLVKAEKWPPTLP